MAPTPLRRIYCETNHSHQVERIWVTDCTAKLSLKRTEFVLNTP